MIKVRGTSSAGNPIFSVTGRTRSPRNVRNPEARKIPTAVMSATRVGIMPTTVLSPSLAPFTKSSYTFDLFTTP